MKYFFVSSILLLAFATNLQAEETDKTEADDVSFRAMPTVSSNPTQGTGLGATAVVIYKADEESSPSQGILTGQYTDTDSYNVFAVNKMFFSNDKWQSNTVAGIVFNNSAFDLTGDFAPPVLPPIEPDGAVKFNVEISVVLQQLLYEIHDDYYIGGQIMLIDQSFSGLNPLGEIFLKAKGVEDSTRGGYGFTLTYDSRTKKERFYPTDSTFINFNVNQFPEALGTKQQYYNSTLNARKYIPGFKTSDVFAMQAYLQYSSENTPDGALAALGARNILRGFPIGLYKTRNMLATQGEYRYLVGESRFRLTAFGGYAKMSGGSKGTASGNRDEDNGDYYSGGFGVHFILEEKQQLDYRVNVAYTSDDEVSLYASINQAF